MKFNPCDENACFLSASDFVFLSMYLSYLSFVIQAILCKNKTTQIRWLHLFYGQWIIVCVGVWRPICCDCSIHFWLRKTECFNTLMTTTHNLRAVKASWKLRLIRNHVQESCLTALNSCQCMNWIRLIAAVQVAAGVVEVKVEGVEASATEGFITRMFTVWCCCEGEMRDAGTAERNSAVGLSSGAVTHFMELNTEQTGWRQTLRHTAGY